MLKATKKSSHGNNNLLQEESEVPSSLEDTASSDQEIDQEPDPGVSFHPSRAQQAIPNICMVKQNEKPISTIPNMFMPHIEGPKLDWTVNDALYQRFLKWHLKWENIPECQLTALPE